MGETGSVQDTIPKPISKLIKDGLTGLPTSYLLIGLLTCGLTGLPTR